MRPARPVAPGFFPLDEELGLSAAQLSPWLVEATVRLGTWMPFEQVPAALAFFSGVQIDAETARRLTEDAGAALEQAETAAVERLEQEPPEPPVGPAVQQLSADGAMVPLVGGQWAEVKTVAIGTVSERQTAAGERLVQTRDLSYFSRMADHERFERLAWGEVYRRGTPRAGTVVGVMDGSEWLQGFLDYHRPDAVRILDFPHGVEHLTAAAQASLGQDTAASRCWLGAAAHELKTGEPAAVLAAVCQLPVEQATLPEQAAAVRDQTVAYFAKRWGQIQYAQFQAQGYPIGSGAVESANKLVVEARLKGSGMHWAPQNINPLLALRNAACSDRWDEVWPQLWQHQQRAVRRRCRRAEKQLVRQSVPLPTPMPEAGPCTPLEGPAALPPPARAPLVVNARPTDRHPWKRFPLLHKHRERIALNAKL
jgi:hypothetical protein